MNVECIYAGERDSFFISLKVQEGAMIQEVIKASGILEQYPELVLEKLNVGIFSQKKTMIDIVHPGDRVEIYRPLLIKPMDARRLRDSTPKKRRKF